MKSTSAFWTSVTSAEGREPSSRLLMPIVEVNRATQNIGVALACELGAMANLWGNVWPVYGAQRIGLSDPRRAQKISRRN